MVRIGIDELHAATKESPHLILESCPLPVQPPAAIVKPDLPHELVQRAAEHQLAALRPYRFGADPRQEQTRDITVG